ncbi:hypothetical protein, partial, partial [Parasitella parasitica]
MENSWHLPFDARLGTDITTKLILSNKTVINTVVQNLLGSSIPNNTYTTSSAEWADGKRSDLLYTPKNGAKIDLPPILIEVQNRVDQKFMLRLINYCANVYDRYEVLPVVLVFVVGKFASAKFEEKFVKKASTPYILETQCEHWASCVNFVSAMSIQDYIHDSMDPFLALIYLITSQSQSLESLTFGSNSTVRF